MCRVCENAREALEPTAAVVACSQIRRWAPPLGRLRRTPAATREKCSAVLLASRACDTLLQMNIIPAALSSSRMGLRVFILVLAWVVVASLSWADLSGLHAETNGALADLQQATEPDLDELRDDAPTILATDEGLTAGLSLQASSNVSLSLASTGDALFPTRVLRSKLSIYRL